LRDIFESLREHYLALVESIVVGTLYEDPPLPVSGASHYDPHLREYGADWPSKAFSMIGVRRMRNFRSVIESVIGGNIPGDIVEAGVWRGGAAIMARAVLAAYGVIDRRVIVLDSFAGLPPPNPEAYPKDANSVFHSYPELAVPLDEVKRNFEKFGLLDEQVVLVPGWFKDTLPTAPVKRIAVLRLDGDMYESTMQALDHLYDKVAANGWIVIDDYELVPACKAAVDDFLAARSVTPDLFPIDGVGVFFRKPFADEPLAAGTAQPSEFGALPVLPHTFEMAAMRKMAEALIRSTETTAQARLDAEAGQNEAKRLAEALMRSTETAAQARLDAEAGQNEAKRLAEALMRSTETAAQARLDAEAGQNEAKRLAEALMRSTQTAAQARLDAEAGQNEAKRLAEALMRSTQTAAQARLDAEAGQNEAKRLAEALMRSTETAAQARLDAEAGQSEAKRLSADVDLFRSKLSQTTSAAQVEHNKARRLALRNESLSKQLKDAKERIAISQTEAAESADTLRMLYASRSWRMTAGYRALGLMLRDRSRRDTPEREPQGSGEPADTSVRGPSVIWIDENTLRVNEVNFLVTFDDAEMRSTESVENCFLLAKSRTMVDRAVLLRNTGPPIQRILDIGIFKGGSVVLYDQLFHPSKLVALEHALGPIDPLDHYIISNDRSHVIRLCYGVNQADGHQVGPILASEFPSADIDLVVDDASHLYEETRASFNLVFPYMRSGARFVLEDWAWAHWSADTWQHNSYFAERKALSNLLIELFMLSASRPDLIADIAVNHEVVIITKGNGSVPLENFDIADYYVLRGKTFGAWL
jgi:O-methyltransferase